MNPLAQSARFECDERLRLYRAAIRKGTITADAAVIDTQVWHAIATALETGAPFGRMLWGVDRIGWGDVIASLDRVRATRARAADKDPALAPRRDAVAAIDAVVRPQAAFFLDLTALLRAGSHGGAKAAA